MPARANASNRSTGTSTAPTARRIGFGDLAAASFMVTLVGYAAGALESGKRAMPAIRAGATPAPRRKPAGNGGSEIGEI
jgi:hypothetical protein